MSGPRLRHNVRALIVENTHRRLLLFRFDLRDQNLMLWATPGGGLEDLQRPIEALARELSEEVGLRISEATAKHVWSERAVGPGHASGYDGALNDFYLVPVPSAFEPRGLIGEAGLRRENIREHQWWSAADLAAAPEGTVFGPRRLPVLFADLLVSVPTVPIDV